MNADASQPSDALDPDPFLIASLRREQQRRRHRYAIVITLAGMFVLIACGSYWIYSNLLTDRGAYSLYRPTHPADPTTVHDALQSMRQAIVEYHLDFNCFMPDRRPVNRDVERLNEFRTESSWPTVVGNEPPADAATYESAPGDRDATFDRIVFTTPLTANFVNHAYSTVLCPAGIAPNGSIFEHSYATVYVKGAMLGQINFGSYATLVVDGDLGGSLIARSYMNAVISGQFFGQLKTESYAMVRVGNGFNGSAEMNHSTLVIDGQASKEQLARIKGSGRVFVRHSDLPDGETQVGDLHIFVGEFTK